MLPADAEIQFLVMCERQMALRTAAFELLERSCFQMFSERTIERQGLPRPIRHRLWILQPEGFELFFRARLQCEDKLDPFKTAQRRKRGGGDGLTARRSSCFGIRGLVALPLSLVLSLRGFQQQALI